MINKTNDYIDKRLYTWTEKEEKMKFRREIIDSKGAF